MSSFYDSFDYPSYWLGRTYEDRSERIALERLFSKIPKKKEKNFVDIGGGFGRLSNLYSPLFKQCLIVEPSIGLIKKGKESLEYSSNVTFSLGSLPKLTTIKNSSFNVAMMVRVIHHLKYPEISLKEISRVLKDDGYLVIEVANKIHFLAKIRAFFSGASNFSKDLSSVDIRSKESIEQGKILFINYHPDKIMRDFESLGFRVIETLSVSNFRNPLIKKIIPLKLLIFLEKNMQKPLAKGFFGPSIFFLVQKID